MSRDVGFFWSVKTQYFRTVLPMYCKVIPTSLVELYVSCRRGTSVPRSPFDPVVETPTSRLPECVSSVPLPVLTSVSPGVPHVLLRLRCTRPGLVKTTVPCPWRICPGWDLVSGRYFMLLLFRKPPRPRPVRCSSPFLCLSRGSWTPRYRRFE